MGISLELSWRARLKELDRNTMISRVADALVHLGRERPQRIAVNGRIASGKTTFAQELSDALRKKDFPVLHVGVDGFHNPSAIRYQQGRSSARGYYEDAYDLKALSNLLLKPLGQPSPNNQKTWSVVTASFDLEMDQAVDLPPVTVTSDYFIIVDGSFLLNHMLVGFWDFKIFLNVERSIAAERGAHRDAERLGGLKIARELHNTRYQAACDLYLKENKPTLAADFIVNNDNPVRPKI